MRGHPVLDAVAAGGVKLGLDRMRDFLAFLGDPHLRAPVVHVAGTNGKGSVCRMVGAMLRARGLKVGVTVSPHLQEINERFLIDDAPVSDGELDAALTALARARDAWARDRLDPAEGVPLTWFELSIAAAWMLFARAGVDVAVVEVGMGGRLDATNVCFPAVTGIVTIGLDHTDQLGPDHASIAGEKAGILKPGVPAVVGPLPPEALRVVRAVAAERGAPLRVWGEDFRVVGDARSFIWEGVREIEGLSLGLIGEHQLVNAAVALALVEALPDPLRPGPEAVRAGLRAARNPGRLEWLGTDLLVDGAHNPDGAAVLAAYLASLPRDRPRTLLLGGGEDKDLHGVAAALAPEVDRILTTTSGHPKARSPWAVAAALEGLAVPVVPAGGVDEALATARAAGGLVVVAGSLYLVGAVRDRLGV